jgi:hypothetical protein
MLRMIEQAMRLNPRYPPWYLVATNLFGPFPGVAKCG